MKNKIKILITSAGSTNGVNVIKALKEQKEIPLFLVATDVNPLAAGFFLADKYYITPKADNPKFTSAILEICKKEKIRIIIPTFSFELPVFSKNKELFRKKGIKMAISDFRTFSIVDDKLKISQYFNKWGIPCPKIYRDKEIKEKKIKFPAIIKPVKATGSKGVFIVNDFEELKTFKNYLKKKSIVQEFIKGDEYTIDGVCDLNGRMIAASPRIRIETKGGLAVKSVTVNDPLIINLTKKIVENFKIIGPFNVQCFKNEKNINFIEINSRFPSGGLPLTVKAGLNVPLIIIKLLLNKKIDKPKIKEDLVMTRYWDSIVLKKINGNYKIL